MGSELIKNINIYRKALAKAGTWHASKKAIAHVETKDLQKGDNTENSYVYEFYCYISVVFDLIKHYDLKFVQGAGKYKNKFHQAASKKAGKPRFEAYDKNGNKVLQICAGTEVDGKYNSETENPDISIQISTASDEPTKNDLIIILDAKYQDDFDSRLNKTQVQAFSTKVNDHFELNNRARPEILFDKLKALDANCLITNVRPHNDNDDMLKDKGIREITKFYLNDPIDSFDVLG
jgi:hypothetical protein